MAEPMTPLVHTDAGALAESTGSREDLVQSHRRAGSSAEEHHVHTVGVGGSNPSPRTAIDPIADMLADEAWRLNVEGRFWSKVARPLGWDACWPWTASIKSARAPYGHFKLKSYVTVTASRVAYALYYGRSPGGLLVCHHCDNPQCVNPSHLFLGTVQDNSDDMKRKGRGSRRDQRGALNGAAKLSEVDVARVRDLIRAGLTNTAIAAQFGVTHQLISRIRRGRSWGQPAIHKPYEHRRSGAPA